MQSQLLLLLSKISFSRFDYDFLNGKTFSVFVARNGETLVKSAFEALPRLLSYCRQRTKVVNGKDNHMMKVDEI